MNTHETIESKLHNELQPFYLLVENESHMHNVPKGSQSHFKVTAVSDLFKDVSLVKRHQMLYRILAKEMEQQVHALAMHLFTPQEWQQGKRALESPNCMGGSKK